MPMHRIHAECGPDDPMFIDVALDADGKLKRGQTFFGCAGPYEDPYPFVLRRRGDEGRFDYGREYDLAKYRFGVSDDIFSIKIEQAAKFSIEQWDDELDGPSTDTYVIRGVAPL